MKNAALAYDKARHFLFLQASNGFFRLKLAV
jgi:hypothetical protein